MQKNPPSGYKGRMKITHSKVLALSFLLLSISRAFAADEPKPKYGPEATTLSKSHEYFRETAAHDFWALIPYYLPQQNGRSCSLASVTMVINAARGDIKLTSEDELATEPSVLKKTGSSEWETAVGPLGKGVTLDELGVYTKKAFEAFGLKLEGIEIVHVNDRSEKTLQRVHQILLENEKSKKDFIISNFDQKVFTGDAVAGHLAPVGAYDSKRKKVLILDPDRQWYEPYWVSERTFLEAMNTSDSIAKNNRGLIWIKLK